MAGAPIGNQNAVKAKRWQQAVDRALEKRGKGDAIAELDRLADKFLDTVEEMTAGTEKRGPDIGGFKELADRLDGKPAQALPVSGDDSAPPVAVKATVEFINASAAPEGS